MSCGLMVRYDKLYLRALKTAIASLIYRTEPKTKERYSQRRQTSPPVPPPDELDEIYALPWSMKNMSSTKP